MVQEHDEPILKHLKDIKVKMSESDPMVGWWNIKIRLEFIRLLIRFALSFKGFTLEFHFEPNEFFSNTILTKEYEMKCSPDENDPFSFEGPEIVKCKG